MTAARADRQDAGPGVPLGCDLGVVAGFLDRWAEPAATRHLLVSILPDTRHPQGKTFDWPSDRATALRWIEGNVPRCGLYWTVNVCRSNLMKKALKSDVRVLRGIWADLDPLDAAELGDKRRDLNSERERLYALARELQKHQYPPTVVIGSGNGIQVIYRLAEPIEANEEYVPQVEQLGRRIECCARRRGEHLQHRPRCCDCRARSTGPTPGSAGWAACQYRPASSMRRDGYTRGATSRRWPRASRTNPPSTRSRSSSTPTATPTATTSTSMRTCRRSPLASSSRRCSRTSRTSTPSGTSRPCSRRRTSRHPAGTRSSPRHLPAKASNLRSWRHIFELTARTTSRPKASRTGPTTSGGRSMLRPVTGNSRQVTTSQRRPRLPAPPDRPTANSRPLATLRARTAAHSSTARRASPWTTTGRSQACSATRLPRRSSRWSSCLKNSAGGSPRRRRPWASRATCWRSPRSCALPGQSAKARS